MEEEFALYDEFEEKELDEAFLEALIDQLSEEEAKPAIVNPARMTHIGFSYAVMKYLTKDIPGGRVSYQLNEPFKEVGSVSVEAANLCFSKTEWFARAAEFANNMEVYPLENGMVRLTLTFFGIATKIQEEGAE